MVSALSMASFLTAGRQDLQSEQVRQSLEDYRGKIRFKQVKFSIIVLAWQFAILILRFVSHVVTLRH